MYKGKKEARGKYKGRGEAIRWVTSESEAGRKQGKKASKEENAKLPVREMSDG